MLSTDWLSLFVDVIDVRRAYGLSVVMMTMTMTTMVKMMTMMMIMMLVMTLLMTMTMYYRGAPEQVCLVFTVGGLYEKGAFKGTVMSSARRAKAALCYAA